MNRNQIHGEVDKLMDRLEKRGRRPIGMGLAIAHKGPRPGAPGETIESYHSTIRDPFCITPLVGAIEALKNAASKLWSDNTDNIQDMVGDIEETILDAYPSMFRPTIDERTKGYIDILWTRNGASFCVCYDIDAKLYRWSALIADDDDIEEFSGDFKLRSPNAIPDQVRWFLDEHHMLFSNDKWRPGVPG